MGWRVQPGTLRVDGFVTLEPQALVAAARVFLSKHRVKEPSLNVSMDRGIRLDLDSDSESEDGAGCSSRKVPWDWNMYGPTCTMKIKKM